MKKSVSRISEAEWIVMKVLWSSDAPKTAKEIISALEGQNEWSPKIASVLLNG